jgi:hypothetical protein
MGEASDSPLVTAGELDLDLFAPAIRHISLTVTGEDGAAVKRRFPIRGDLSIPEVGRLRRMERTITEAQTGDETQLLLDTFDELHALVDGLVRELTPDAPELSITYQQAMPLFRWLSGDASFADMIARTLTDGAAGADDDEPEPTGDGEQPEPVSQDAGEAGPFGSSGPSLTASSGSDASTGGSPAGGSRPAAPPPVSRGVSSARTSETPVPA